ncbi:diacylglycerol/lipid kinase family protein [Halovivax gelatinilyticus]|uniref:diacylglycerol/lipid kinase family protein n=1 Tax=Halovivax gelatinilyticus TaxID=2961597 RepID=UPI0020CA5024|nr:YegS/Rv2252/BmrU family lipid kinase [Halovivax gelatinilyticus]
MASERRVVILNPVSGSEDHVDTVVELAGEYDAEVRVTDAAGDARELAREAAPDVDVVVAAGGDGTVNGVVNGIADADALDSTTLCVVPVGTGNNFASNVGVDDVEMAFSVLEGGRRRPLDLGLANDRAFINSCVGGITAEASGATTSKQKREFGVLAYVRETVDRVTEFDPLPLRVETTAGPDGGPTSWTGEALFVFVGNARRFSGRRTAQANVEDGCFEVIVIGELPTGGLVGENGLERLFDRETEHIVRRRTPSVSIESAGGPVPYSLDGEVLETDRLSVAVAPTRLSVAVGDGYRIEPDDR